MISFLKESDHVVKIENLQQGYDLAVVFCVPNLSLYNKLMWDFLQRFKRTVLMAETYPIVVKHMYPQKYLAVYRKDSEIIVSGDRDVYNIRNKEKMILKLLYQNPTETIINIHKKTKLNPKTITRLKKNMEENRVIRKYTTNFNVEKLGVKRKHVLISSRDLTLADDKKILQFSLVHPNIVSLTKLIGNYDILIEIEEEETTKKDVLKDLRTNFSISKYKIIEGGNLIKDKYIPKNVIADED